MNLQPDGNTAWRYGRTSIFLHWTLALLLALLVGLGWVMVSVEDDPAGPTLLAIHMSLGLTAGALIAARLAWRLSHPPFLPPRIGAGWQERAARATHHALYVLMVLMPVTGYLGASLGERRVAWFGLPLPEWATRSDAWKEQLFAAHSVIAWALVATVALHVLAALKHLLVDRDTVFWRMWPRRR